MEQTCVKEKLESKIIKNEDLNNLSADKQIKDNDNIKLEPELDDFQIELYPHFTENASMSMISKHEEPEQEWNKNEEQTSHCSFNDIVPELKQTEIKLEASDFTVKLEKFDMYKDLKIEEEENIIIDEKADLILFPNQRESRQQKNPTKATKFKCNQCEYATAYKAIMKKHVLKHKNPEEVSKFQCYHCKYATIRKGDLKRHLINHKNPEEGRMFKCDLCKHDTAYKNNMESHLIEHKDQDVGKLKCDQCGIVTVRKSDLKRHLLIHKNPEDVRKFKCDQCEYATVRKDDLKRHLIKHTNREEVRKFKCDQCDFVTVRKSDLKRHRMRHKKFECDQCEHATIYNYNLQ